MNELSHEIDLIDYLFQIKKIHSKYNSKISKLKINVDDILNLNLECNRVKFCSLNINFFDFMNERKIRLVGKDVSIEADLLKNSIKIFNNLNKKVKNIYLKKINTYIKLHNSIIKNNSNDLCDLIQGQNLLKHIHKIKNG